MFQQQWSITGSSFNFSLLEILLECLLGLWRSCSWYCAYLEANLYLLSQLSEPGYKGGWGKEALPGRIILKCWVLWVAFFRDGLVAGYLDSGVKVCNHTHQKYNRHELFVHRKKSPSFHKKGSLYSIKRDLFIP